jgi:hypothetical protein
MQLQMWVSCVVGVDAVTNVGILCGRCRCSYKCGYVALRVVQIMTLEFTVDLDCFVLGRADLSLFVTSNRCIPVKNTLG